LTWSYNGVGVIDPGIFQRRKYLCADYLADCFWAVLSVAAFADATDVAAGAMDAAAVAVAS